MPFRMAAAGDERRTKRARHTGAATFTTSRRQRRSFSMLPDDLLCLIYRLLSDYPSSRACFAAVCMSWRAAIAAEPRVPVLPWLLLSPRDADMGDRTRRAHCPQDGVVMRIATRLGALGRRLVGGYDGCWVVSCHPPPIRIVNLFSGAELALSEKQSQIACPRRDHGRGDTRGPVIVSKIVFSEPPTSDTCIMAAMTENCGMALCRVGCPRGGWTIHGCHGHAQWRGRFMDIAFCNGELYGLTPNGEELVKFEIGKNKDGAPVVIGDTRVALQMVGRDKSKNSCKEFAAYIVDLHGKLAIAMKTWWWHYREPFFKVFELVDIQTHGEATWYQKWVEVTTLDDHALFLGQTFSKAVHVPTNMRGDIERNRIYYANNCLRSLNAVIHGDAVILTISKHDGDLEYDRKDRTSVASGEEKITSVGYFMKCGVHDIMWLLPPDI